MSESFPRQHARTRRFTLGAPRSFTLTERGVFLCRSSGGADPINRLIEVDQAGVETVVIDPHTLELDESHLPAAERARRERAREAAGGVTSYAAAGADVVVCALGGRLLVARRLSAGWQVRELPTPAGVFDPRPSPDGRSVAYLVGDELRLIGIEGDDDRRLAGGDGDEVSWGQAEFVAAEEMGRSRGYWWSPSSDRLLVARVDESPVARWWISAPVDPHEAPRAVRYPAAGTANARVELFLISVADGSRVPVERGPQEYLVDAGWDAEGAWVLEQPRDQRSLVLSSIDPASGATRALHRIDDEHWVEPVPGSPWRHEGRLLTVEDRGEARRLCVDGRPRTPDDLQVRSIVGAHGDRVWLLASSVPTETDLWVLDLTSEALERLSEPGGVHQASLGPEGSMVIGRADLDHDGTRFELITAQGRRVPLENRAEQPTVTAAPQLMRRGTRRLDTALLLPRQPVEGPLPVLLDPYGGPHAQRVVAARNGHAVSQWFADAGFAVLVVDGRGTPGRGPAWERAVAGDLAGPVLDDQLDALDGLVADERFDADRVAIRGWSFGGFLAALAVLERPDRFHAAIAGAPVADWRLYDTHYTERYLGHPDDQPDAYERSGLLGLAGRAQGPDRPLLIIHGLADDNVVAAHSLRLSRALLEAARPHQLLPLSGVTHMTPQEVVAESLLELQLDFLRRSLAPGAS